MPFALRSLVALFLALLVAAPALAASPVRISGVLFDGVMKGNPEPESAIRLTNTDPRKEADIGGFSLTDELTPGPAQKVTIGSAGDRRPGARQGQRRSGRRSHTVRIPSSARIAPLADVWVAHRGDAFKEVFGFPPDFETVNTLSDVPDLEHGSGWLIMPAKHGTVALQDAFGNVIDFVAYDRNKEPKWRPQELPDRYWKGQAVRLYRSSAYGWTGRVLARDRDESGALLPDTDSAADWDSGFAHKQLGMEPAHRVELPGQSHFRANVLKNVRAKVLATSAPDNNYKTLIAAFRAAKKRIRISVYQLTSPQITDVLIKKVRQGVKVTLWLEGSPVAGIPDQERYLVDRLAKAGAQVYFLVSDSERKVKPRYRFDHSKYVLIDDDKVIIGTENYGRTGVPVHPSYGNRGWMIHIQSKALFKQLDAVWRHDLRRGYRDVVHIDDEPTDAYGLPYRKAAFEPDTGTIQRGQYGPPVKPVFVNEPMDLELVLSPDTSLNENSAIIGMIGRAKQTLYVQQNSVRRRWGSKSDTVEDAPTLPLEAVVAAARRGVKVRVLLDGYWYNTTDDDRDNDDTARFLNELARTEGLDVSAKVINLKSSGLEKIHAKGVIVDEREVFVGSINWSENSFKGNREVGVVVHNKKVSGYYADLFKRDWSESRMYEVPAKGRVLLRTSPSAKGKAIGRAQPGQRLPVVGEHGGTATSGPAWLEVRLGRSRTAFVPASATGEATARAHEALHLLERDATIEGKVVVTRVSDKVIHLRFDDEQRAPFVAVIFRKSESRFTDKGLNPANAFQGRQVRVRGRVQRYKVPEIILSSPEQIEIVP